MYHGHSTVKKGHGCVDLQLDLCHISINKIKRWKHCHLYRILKMHFFPFSYIFLLKIVKIWIQLKSLKYFIVIYLICKNIWQDIEHINNKANHLLFNIKFYCVIITYKNIYIEEKAKCSYKTVTKIKISISYTSIPFKT